MNHRAAGPGHYGGAVGEHENGGWNLVAADGFVAPGLPPDGAVGV